MQSLKWLLVILVIMNLILFGFMLNLDDKLFPKETADTAVFTIHDMTAFDIVSPPNQIAPHYSEDEDEFNKLQESRNRYDYGGGGVDPKHLGGFKNNDTKSYDRELWEWIIPTFNVSSVLDIGCGMGFSTPWKRKPKEHGSMGAWEHGSMGAWEYFLIFNF